MTTPIRKFRWWHEHIIDDMLARPFDTLAARARRLGYSVSYLSTLTNSDLFRAAYNARREEYSAVLTDALARKAGEVANKGLDILLEQLETKRTSLPFEAVAETTMSVLERLGFAPSKTSSTQVNVQVNNATPTVSAEVLEEARSRLREVERRALAPPRPEE